MDTTKEELRPIEIGHGYTKNIKKGYFHRWFKKVGEQGDEYMWALVELEDGKVIEESADAIKFMDRLNN